VFRIGFESTPGRIFHSNLCMPSKTASLKGKISRIFSTSLRFYVLNVNPLNSFVTTHKSCRYKFSYYLYNPFVIS